MLLAAGTKLGPYLVEAQIGAGGMGEVYRAHDTRLGRDVAVKILPASFSEDGDRLRRFQIEARVIAALNHPNLLSLFDTGLHEGSPYLVTELLEGETLRQRMGGKPMPPKRTLEIAIQIAHGLAAAHDQNIVHRDLKPENIFITRDGRAKILDFGLAKLWKPPSLMGSDTVPLDGIERMAGVMTEPFDSNAGMILGTVGYMAPEQIRSEQVDGRTDIFALGAILFELLMGRPPFQAQSPIETMNAILKDETPELDPSLPGLTPVLDHLVRRCLEKQPERRFQSVHDLAFAMEHTTGSAPSLASGAWPKVERRSARKRHAAFAKAALVGLATGLVLGASAFAYLRTAPRAAPITFRPLTYSGSDGMPSASPDGGTLAFTSDRDGHRRIWLKQMTGGNEVALTDGPDDAPRFSRDGSTILFHRSLEGHEALYRISALGGDAQKVVDRAVEGDWSPDGKQVVFLRLAPGPESQVGVVSLQEGGEHILLKFAGQALHPRWSPDGRRILLVGGGSPSTLLLLRADTGALVKLAPMTPTRPCSSVLWTSSDRFLYLQPDRGEAQGPTGGARLVAQSLRWGRPEVLAWVPSFSEVLDRLGPGSLVLEEIKGRSSLALLPLQGGGPVRWLTRGDALDRGPALSPDGRMVAFSSNRGGAQNIWLLDLGSQALRRVTDHTGVDRQPAFSPDGVRLFWSSDRGGPFEIWTSEVEGGPPTQVSHDGAEADHPCVSRDGQWVYYHSGHPDHGGIWRVHADGGDPERLVPDGMDPSLSPDGGLLLYRLPLGSTGCEVRFLDLHDRRTLPSAIRIGLEAGVVPSPYLGRAQWGPDGNHVFFIDEDGAGRSGISTQAFAPGQDTSATRQRVATSEPDSRLESLVLSTDGSRMIAAERQRLTSLVALEGLGAEVRASNP